MCISWTQTEWKFNDGNLPDNVVTYKSELKSTTYVLEIDKLSSSHSGKYTCYGKAANDDQYMSFISVSHIHVYSEHLSFDS